MCKKHFLFNIKPFVDMDGYLAVIEQEKEIPFKIKRIFYEYGVDYNSIRGKHANKNSKFCLIAVSGSCEVVADDGVEKKKYFLNSPDKILFLDKMVWKTMTKFSTNCVLLIISDNLYDKEEYIRDYNEFCDCIKNNNY